MPSILKNFVVKWVIVAVEAVVLIILAGWVAKNYLGALIARKPSIHNLNLAEKYSPGDAYYPHMQGRLYQYSLNDVDPSMALVKLSRAVRLNTYEPQSWLDLGAALELQGEIEPAEQCLRRADFLAPRQPGDQWAIANFFILHGNIDEAFKHLQMVLASDPSYDATIFTTAW
ncbi:MAG: tetratricopeptide repeat protein, partial [Terriglobia bacterium]